MTTLLTAEVTTTVLDETRVCGWGSPDVTPRARGAAEAAVLRSAPARPSGAVVLGAPSSGSEPAAKPFGLVRGVFIAGAALTVGALIGAVVLVVSALAYPYDCYLRARRR